MNRFYSEFVHSGNAVKTGLYNVLERRKTLELERASGMVLLGAPTSL